MPTIARFARVAAMPALLLAGAPVPQAARAPVAVVREFYRYHFAHDMAFTRAAIRRRAGWLAPDLLSLCRAYFAAPSPADEPPSIEGDPFTDSQEYPSAFRIGAAAVSGDTALVPVTFTWRGGGTQPGITVVLTRARRWRIADIRFGRGGTLRDLLTGKQ